MVVPEAAGFSSGLSDSGTDVIVLPSLPLSFCEAVKGMRRCGGHGTFFSSTGGCHCGKERPSCTVARRAPLLANGLPPAS